MSFNSHRMATDRDGNPSGSPSRRSFLKNTGLVAAALTARPAWSRVVGANDRINVALIGLGARGSDHLSLLLEHRQNKPDIEIVALCDVYQKRLSMASKRTSGAKTYVHHQEVLQRSDIDVVFTATPDHWHAPIALAAMEAGKDVYVEKPMTHTVEECKVVAHRAKELKRIVQVGVQGTSWNRWHKIREIIQSGMIGQVVEVQGTYSRNAPGGDWNGGPWWSIDPAAGPLPRAIVTLTGNNGWALLHRCLSMPIGFFVSANTGILRKVGMNEFGNVAEQPLEIGRGREVGSLGSLSVSLYVAHARGPLRPRPGLRGKG